MTLIIICHIIRRYLKYVRDVNCIMAKAVKKGSRKKATLGHFDHEQFFSQLSERIRNLRKANGFTSYEGFANDIEISRVGMGRYESGTFNDIQMTTLLKIIDGLEVTPKEFFSKGFE
jgi:DNA-binding XRE family transcriptional regulator